MFVTTKDADTKLVEMIDTIRPEAAMWRGMHFRFARLQEHYRSTYQITIAVNLINDLLKSHQGSLFVGGDCNLFLLVKNVTRSQLDKVIFQLRYLFADDPLAYNSEGEDNPEFCRLYDLSIQWQEFMDVAKRRVVQAVAKPREAETVQPSASGTVGLKTLTPISLVKLEQELRGTDLSRVMRKQPICASVPNTPIRRVFDEFYINIGHLRQALQTDIDLHSNRWLFKYLTQLLDLRMLEMLGTQAARVLDKPVSINLNTETLLSEQFKQFDQQVKALTKIAIVVEIHVSDVFADMEAFLIAKEVVQQMGYRVCLDGLTAQSFVQLDRERLGFDLAKLQWNADQATDLKNAQGQALQAAINRCGATRVILCRCDNRQAVEYGQALGISLFQGRFLDRMLDPTSRIEN